jgi:peptide/nickel transport system substrate-binding protein
MRNAPSRIEAGKPPLAPATRCVDRLLAALCILNSVLMFAGCSKPAPARETNYLVVAQRTSPNSLDPRLASDEATARISQLVFSSLLSIGDDLRPQPQLAERLENPDALHYVAHLRHGVKFHDGHELSARDVVYTYAMFLDPAYVSPYQGAFTALRSVRVIDDYTVEFTVKAPFGAFPMQLIPIPIVPDGRSAEMKTHPIGTGPYKFVRYAVDDQLVLAAFDDYFDGAPANRGLILKVIPDDTMRGLELRKKTVDVTVNDMSPDIVHGLEERGDVIVKRAPGVDFSYVGVNMQDPVLRDRRVRYAIGYAINREAIIKYLRRDLARAALGLVPPSGWAFEPNVFTFSYDPARAVALLEEAGYHDPDGPGGPLPRLSLTLKIGTSEETRLQGTVIQQDLAKVGIALDVRSYETATLFADLVRGDFQLSNPQWVGGAVLDPDILRRVFHSSQVPPAGFNRGRYSNPEVDRLLDIATAAVGEAERKKDYSDVQKLVAEDAPYIPIWNRVNYIMAQPTLSGLHLNPISDFIALKDVRKNRES